VRLADVHRRGHAHELAEAEGRAAAASLEPTPPAQALAFTTLAGVLLENGRPGEAVAWAEEAMRIVNELGAIPEGESLVRLTLIEALDASGRHDSARRALVLANARLSERAAGIRANSLRTTFLTKIIENAQTIALGVAWGSRPTLA
jgi:hypothetical protein